MASSGRKLVLVTGANGFIAARTCEAFLEAGYDVRGTVRSVSSGGPIQEALNSYVKTGRLQITIVPDITEPGAFDKAVEGEKKIHFLNESWWSCSGCYAIAHLAAPVSFSFKDPVPVIHGAVNGTKTLLNSAYKYGKDLSNVIIMSSIVSITSPREPGHIYSEKDWNEFSEGEVEKKGAGASSMDIYSASKTA
jgi:nucleoside-diphosphate-sugar epimerase